MALFSAYEVIGGTRIPAYFIESTAPDDIDANAAKLEPPRGTEFIDPDAAIDKIVDHLAAAEHPSIVIAVHGFNSPRSAVLDSYARAFTAVNNDRSIQNSGIVCIGYRWPSESIGTPWRSAWSAAPPFLQGFLGFGLALFAAGILVTVFTDPFLAKQPQILRALEVVLATFFVTVPLALFILRFIVYFRDGYRATSYGIPDLVEIIRQIDVRLNGKISRSHHVALSFQGHSMGAYVVTSAVRILSDVFDPIAIPPNLTTSKPRISFEARIAQSSESPFDAPPHDMSKIGHVFCLTRLVLISPDIPAETVMSNRGNFLASSLHRFKEAYLFSNEADEVLRQISTTANFFSLPTLKHRFGYRLGNVGVIADSYGVTRGIRLDKLRIAKVTLQGLTETLGAARSQPDAADSFAYFDCTYGVDGGTGVVSFAKPGKETKITKLEHFRLLVSYLFIHKPDVHAGYFSSDFFKQIIYRFTCLGFAETMTAYGGPHQFETECQQHQLKVMLKR